jgi:hypothetical protein
MEGGRLSESTSTINLHFGLRLPSGFFLMGAKPLVSWLFVDFEKKQTTSTDFTQNRPDSGREKKTIDAQKSRQWDGASHAPVHVSLCHVAAPFPLHNPVKADGLASSAPSAANSAERGADTPPWFLPHCCLSRTELHPPSMHTHTPSPPLTSARSTSNTEDQTHFLLRRPNH